MENTLWEKPYYFWCLSPLLLQEDGWFYAERETMTLISLRRSWGGYYSSLGYWELWNHLEFYNKEKWCIFILNSVKNEIINRILTVCQKQSRKLHRIQKCRGMQNHPAPVHLKWLLIINWYILNLKQVASLRNRILKTGFNHLEVFSYCEFP